MSGSGSVSCQEKSTQHHPGSSTTTPPAQPTTANMGGASTKQSSSTTKIFEEKSTQQPDSPTHHPLSQEPATNDASVMMTSIHGGISLNGFETSSFFLVLVILLLPRDYSIRMIRIGFLKIPASIQFMIHLLNRHGHGFPTVTARTLLISVVLVFLYARWMGASTSVMQHFQIVIEKRLPYQNLVAVEFVLFTNRNLLTYLVVLNVI